VSQCSLRSFSLEGADWLPCSGVCVARMERLAFNSGGTCRLSPNVSTDEEWMAAIPSIISLASVTFSCSCLLTSVGYSV
jgi:hypothetical protein